MYAETDPKTLPQWKGRPVPWITRWTGQVYDTDQPEYRLSIIRGQDGRAGISYRDPQEYRDEHGVLWLKEGLVRSGEPLWKAVSTTRQREAMRRGLCQVCGVKISTLVEGDSIPWLVDEPEWESFVHNQEKGAPVLTVMAPVCPGCIGLATRLCPALLKGFRLLRVDLYKRWGVHGQTMLNNRLQRGFVGYDEHLRLPLTVARQQLVELEAYDEIGEWT